MKKIFLGIVLSVAMLYSSTLVVDNNPTYSWFGWSSPKSCENTNNPYSTIQDAIDHASNGDTIEICKGTYNENVNITKNNLTIKGVDGQAIDDVVVDGGSDTAIEIKAQNETFDNFKIKSSGNYGIHENTSGGGSHTFKNLIIDSYNDGIYLSNGDKQTFQNLTITSHNDKGIQLSTSTTGDHTFKNITVNSKEQAIYVGKGGKSFIDLNLTSSDSTGLLVYSVNTALTFDNITINSNKRGIMLGKHVTGTKDFQDINISSKNEGIYIAAGKKAIFDTIEVNSTDSKGIYLDSSSGEKHTFNNIIINSKNDAIHAAKGFSSLNDANLTSSSNTGIYLSPTEDVTISNVKIKSENYGIDSRNGSKVNITIKNTYIDTDKKNDGIYIGNADKLTVDSVCISNVTYGIKVDSQINSADISNSKIDNTTNWDIWLPTQYPSTVNNNCLSGAKLASTNSNNNNFDGNYWDGVTDTNGDGKITSADSSKIGAHVVDNSPNKTCKATGCSGATTPPKPIVNYQMDACSWDGTSGEVKDSSGNSYNGTAVNGANTESNTIAGGILCRVGKFNGNDYIRSDHIYDYLKGSASLSFWIKTTQRGNNTDWEAPGVTGVEQAGGVDDIFWGWIDANGHIGISKGNNDNNSKSNTPINNGKWHHVVLTRNATNGNVKIYIDGVLDKTGSTDTGDVGTSFKSIGRIEDTGGTPEYFNGYLDEVKIYNRILTSSEVQTIYDNEKDGKNYDGSARTCHMCSLPKPIVNYQMDACSWDGTSGEVKDSSGDYNGTAVDGANTESNVTAGGGLCRVGDFNSSDTVNLPSNPNLQISGSQTYMAWIKHNPSNKQLSDIFMNGGWGNALRMQDDNTALFEMQIGGKDRQLYSTSAINDDKWHFIVGVYDKADNKMKLYIDGDLNNTLNVSGKLDVYKGDSYIASENNNGYYFNGNIDEVKVFNTNLYDRQIKTIYDNEKDGKNYDGSARTCHMCSLPKPIANYRMDACSWDGTSGEVKDSSGNDLNGVAKNGANTDVGKLCRGGKFDGSNDYVEISNNSLLNPTGAFTSSVWFKADSISRWQGVVSKLTDVNSHTGRGWNIQVGTAQKIASLMADSNGNYVYLKSTTTPQTGQWYYVVLVHHADNQNDLYINGIKEASNTHAIAFTNNPLQIGKFYTNDNALYFDGLIDEVKIFDKALPANQVQTIYNNEKDGKNYDGSARTCLVCNANYYFDAWDTFRSKNNRNISTEIVNRPFDLNISSLNKDKTDFKEFNGTVCSKIILDDGSDTNVTGWKKRLFNDKNSSDQTLNGNPRFNVTRAIKKARVEIIWQQNVDATCADVNDSTDHNETNSTDNFAIRPEQFHIDTNTTYPKAGVNFHIDVNASSYNGENSLDYHETNNTSFVFDINDSNATCVKGILKGLPTPFGFSNGSISFDANYSDVGDVNFSIKEVKKCTDRFAGVDCKDKNVSGYWNTDANLSIPRIQ